MMTKVMKNFKRQVIGGLCMLALFTVSFAAFVPIAVSEAWATPNATLVQERKEKKRERKQPRQPQKQTNKEKKKQPGKKKNKDNDRDQRASQHQQAFEAQRRGEIAQYSVIKKSIERQMGAKIIGQKLFRTNQGWVYQLTLRGNKGQISKVNVDAKTSKILSKKE